MRKKSCCMETGRQCSGLPPSESADIPEMRTQTPGPPQTTDTQSPVDHMHGRSRRGNISPPRQD